MTGGTAASPTQEVMAELLPLVGRGGRRTGAKLSIHWGPDHMFDLTHEAAHLRAVGASWDWVAIGFGSASFWLRHVGIVPVPAGGGCIVGLHWSIAEGPRRQSELKELIPGGVLSKSDLTQEYQLNCADADGIAVYTPRDAAEQAVLLTLRIVDSDRFLTSTPERQPIK